VILSSPVISKKGSLVTWYNLWFYQISSSHPLHDFWSILVTTHTARLQRPLGFSEIPRGHDFVRSVLLAPHTSCSTNGMSISNNRRPSTVSDRKLCTVARTMSPALNSYHTLTHGFLSAISPDHQRDPVLQWGTDSFVSTT
jgi:hypothetical protein